MRTPSFWLIAILLATLGASLFWGAQERRELARLQVEEAADREADAELKGRLTLQEDGRLPAETSLQGRSDSEVRRMFPESHSLPWSASFSQFNSAVDRDPVWAPFYRKLVRRRILARYNLLLSSLKLAPEKLASLEDLLVERSITSRHAVHEMRATDPKLSSPPAMAAIGRATEEVDEKISRLVGADVAKSLREWNGAIYYYGNVPDGLVAQDAVALNDAGFQLSADQLVRLALIRYEVYALAAGFRPGASPDQVDTKTGLTRLETRMLARQAEVLSPDEIAILRDWAIERHRARAAVDALREKFHVETRATAVPNP
jgi:hypothetical protein